MVTTLQHTPPSPSLCPLLWPTLCGLIASTGLRVGEALRLTGDEVVLDADPPHLRIVETKFRKSRIVPLHPSTAERLRLYATQRRQLGYHSLSDVFFLSRTGKRLHRSTVARGRPLSRDGVDYLLQQAVSRALPRCPTLANKSISPHTLRHTTAMHLLQSGVDLAVIAL